MPTNGISTSALRKTPASEPSVEIAYSARDGPRLLELADAEADRVGRDAAQEDHRRGDQHEDGEQRADERAGLDAVERVDRDPQERPGDERHGRQQRRGDEHEPAEAGEASGRGRPAARRASSRRSARPARWRSCWPTRSSRRRTTARAGARRRSPRPARRRPRQRRRGRRHDDAPRRQGYVVASVAAHTVRAMTTAELRAADREALWHPFTQQQGWSAEDAPIIERGEGCTLVRHRRQRLHRRRLVAVVQRPRPPPPGDRRGGARRSSTASRTRRCSASRTRRRSSWPQKLLAVAPRGDRELTRVFYSDNGSTANEIALKMAFQFHKIRGDEQRTKFVYLDISYHGDTIGSVSVGGIDLFHTLFRPLLFEGIRTAPGDVAGLERDARRARRRGRRADHRAAGPGRGRHPPAPRRLPARGARAVRRARHLHDLRRGRDRLRAHRHDVRLRAGGRGARPHERGQGPDGRLPAARRDAGDRAHLRGLPRRVRGVPHVLPRPHLHGQPAGLRGGDRHAAGLRGRAARSTRWRPRSSCSASCSTSTSRRWPRSPRSAAAGRWSASS